MATVVSEPTSAGSFPPDGSGGTLSCCVNGQEVEVQLTESGWTLLDVLRDQLGITSPKNGCQPQAQCGCCTILMDGKPVLSCALKAEKAEGKTITTLEGLDEVHRAQISESFVRCGGVQCGFCIPGMAMRGVGLCGDGKEVSRDEITQALKPHLCRCTGYTQIVDSIEQYAKLRRGETLPEMSAADKSGKVGTSLARYTGHDAVLGDRKFIDDMTVPGMLFGAVRLTDHPRTTVLEIDATAALSMPGVHRVFTAADVPGERYVGLIEKDWPVYVAIGEETRCTGDVIASVVADTQRLARLAAEQIVVKYDVKEPVTSPQDGMKEGAPLVHPKRGTNILSRSSLKRGDVEKAFAESAHVLEDSYRTQRIEHLFLEPEACVAVPIDDGDADKWWVAIPKGGTPNAPSDGRGMNGANGTTPRPSPEAQGRATLHERRMHIYTQGQGVFDDQRQCASVLGVDKSRLDVELISNGGAFGGKEDMSIQAQTALMAWLVGRPVKMTLTRPESFRIHPKRHPIELSYKIGCDAEGRITAVRARVVGDKGAYASVGAKVLERAGGHATGPYRVPNIDMESVAVYTNNPPCGAMRGFGANQAAFAIENLLDRLAEKVGIDAYDIRDRNILERGEAFATGQILDKPFGLRKTLESVRDLYKNSKYAGIACGIKNVGIGNGMPDIGKAAITVENENKLHVRTGFTEMGQGLFTLCIQFAVEATGLSPELFLCSTDTVLAGNSIADAGKKLKAALDEGKTLKDLAGQVFHGEWVCNYTSKLGYDLDKPGGPKTHITYGFATQVAILDDDGRLAKIVASHDVGRVLNPVHLDGQMYGSLHMGIGYALTEDFETVGGVIQAKKMNDCGVLRSNQMPEMEVIYIEEQDPECPHGARGVGEIGLVPTAPCIAGALYKYDGIVRRQLPMRDSPAAQAILKPNRKK
jgi:CO/xanthine dehydrogenase Mo-binding subunit/aerobic-type carbon monoxide dehydrogenase small subunit (CoxS/CutS family)